MLSNLAIQYVTATGLFPSFVKRSVLIRELARWVCRHCESTALAGQSAESSARFQTAQPAPQGLGQGRGHGKIALSRRNQVPPGQFLSSGGQI